MSVSVSLADVEKLCWHLSGWRVEQRDVDALLVAVTAYAASHAGGAPRAGLEGGAGDATTPAEPLSAPPVDPETPEPAPGPQTDAQRVHVSGSITVVCTGHCGQRRRRRTRPTEAVRDTAPEGYRICRICGEMRELEEFRRDASSPGGRRTGCRDCENARKRMLRAAERAV